MNLYPAASYLRHLFTARGTEGYGVHSPFMFEFLDKVIRGETDPNILKSVERLRREMLDDRRIISISDLGTGPSGKKSSVRRISEVAATASLPGREAGLLARIVQELRIKNYELRDADQAGDGISRRAYEIGQGPWSKGNGAWSMRGACDESLKAGRQGARSNEQGAWSKELNGGEQELGNGDSGIILELGTSLGISTLALALAAPEKKVVSVEGCPALTAVARENLERHGAVNARILNMEFDDALDKLRTEETKVSFAFIDGNHRGEALKHYIQTIREMGEELILVADDIHINRDMYRAWRGLATSGTALVTLETFRFGILFFLNKLTPGRYRIRY